jgi:hypothetical protein
VNTTHPSGGRGGSSVRGRGADRGQSTSFTTARGKAIQPLQLMRGSDADTANSRHSDDSMRYGVVPEQQYQQQQQQQQQQQPYSNPYNPYSGSSSGNSSGRGGIHYVQGGQQRSSGGSGSSSTVVHRPTPYRPPQAYNHDVEQHFDDSYDTHSNSERGYANSRQQQQQQKQKQPQQQYSNGAQQQPYRQTNQWNNRNNEQL